MGDLSIEMPREPEISNTAHQDPIATGKIRSGSCLSQLLTFIDYGQMAARRMTAQTRRGSPSILARIPARKAREGLRRLNPPCLWVGVGLGVGVGVGSAKTTPREPCGRCCKRYTLHLKHQTPNPKPQTSHLKPQTPNTKT